MRLHFRRYLTVSPIDPPCTGDGPRAAIYCRTSTLIQRIDTQEDECLRYCRQRGYHLVREYLEEGQSGDAPYLGPEIGTRELRARPLFRLMLLDVMILHPFDRLVCWHPDRFSRMHGPETLAVMDALKAHGVRVECLCQQEDIEAVTLKAT